MGIPSISGSAAGRMLARVSGSAPMVDEATMAVDIKQLRQLQATRTEPGIKDAVRTSRDGISTAWARAGVELYRGAPNRAEGAGRVLGLTRAVTSAGTRSVLAKLAHARVRPYDLPGSGITSATRAAPRGSSFPSTHAAVAHAAAGVVQLHGTLAQGAQARAMAEAVSHSRMYLGVHFPSDVAAGEQIGRDAAARLVQRVS